MPEKSSSKSGIVALVTGASSGIGLALAREIAADGHDVVLTPATAMHWRPRPAQSRENTACEPRLFLWTSRHADAADKLYRTISNQKLEIGILVNNAGFGLGGEFLETDLQREVEMIQVNVIARHSV